MRELVPLLVGLVFVAPAGSVTGSGLRGIVRAPAPVCLQDDPCDGARAGVAIVFSRNGRVVKRTASGNQGRYRVTLAPGTYAVSSPAAIGPRGRVMPSRVKVYAGRYRSVDFFVETGVRAP